MNDFYVQLEAQLVEAGQRRANGGRPRLAHAGRGRPLLAAATVLLALVAGVVTVPALRSAIFSSAGRPAESAAPSGGEVTRTGSIPIPVAPAPSLRGIGVAVLNATTTAGLARSVGDQLERHGATLGSMGNDRDQTLPRTVVGHRPGAAPQARRVARVLGVRDIRALRGTDFAAFPRATIVVRVGADRRPR